MEESEGLKRNIRSAKIISSKDAHELLKILKKLSLKERKLSKLYEFRIRWKTNYRFAYVNNQLDYKKVIELIKSWIFYSNTKVPKNKVKFLSDSFFWTKIVGGIGFIIAIIITIILIVAIFFGVIYGIVSIFV